LTEPPDLLAQKAFKAFKVFKASKARSVLPVRKEKPAQLALLVLKA
jgi:hypothetical protein